MGQAGVAQNALLVLADTAALAGDERGGNAAGTARQRRRDARRHGQAQTLKPQVQPLPYGRRAGRRHRMGPAIGKAHRTDGIEEQRAAQIARARFGRRRWRIQPRRQARHWPGRKPGSPRRATRTRRGAGSNAPERTASSTTRIPVGRGSIATTRPVRWATRGWSSTAVATAASLILAMPKPSRSAATRASGQARRKAAAAASSPAAATITPTQNGGSKGS